MTSGEETSRSCLAVESVVGFGNLASPNDHVAKDVVSTSCAQGTCCDVFRSLKPAAVKLLLPGEFVCICACAVCMILELWDRSNSGSRLLLLAFLSCQQNAFPSRKGCLSLCIPTTPLDVYAGIVLAPGKSRKSSPQKVDSVICRLRWADSSQSTRAHCPENSRTEMS